MPLGSSGTRTWMRFRGAADKTKPAPGMPGRVFFCENRSVVLAGQACPISCHPVSENAGHSRIENAQQEANHDGLAKREFASGRFTTRGFG